MNKEKKMVGMVDTVFIIVGCTTLVLSLYLMYITKNFKLLFIWGVSLTMVQIALAWMKHDIKWHIVATILFFLFVLVIILVKIKRRINAALKRIAEIEEEERQKMAELYRTDPELKEMNEFVGDYRDNDSV
jgi:hypothetical protein